MTAQFQVTNLNKNFSSPRGDVIALEGVSFVVSQDEFVCIVGPSGCGKSTLLRLIAGLTEPTGGIVNFSGWLSTPRRAMVFQDTGLFAWLNILENVAFGLETQGIAQNERHQRASELIARMGLSDFARHYPYELSGGMRQRVAIARALVTEPDILLMDEPFRTLDAQTRLVLQDELLRLWRERPMMVLFVTHDIEEAILLGNRVLVLSNRPGHILAEIVVPLEQPRNLTGRSHPEIEALRWQIWKMIEPTVQANLKRAPMQ
ncbi:MAG: ABC transporter ATP-binding protein [Chloroflexi bacterium]|nr:ABC transporter ATP-binding protein [Chloroflexota bacterium]